MRCWRGFGVLALLSRGFVQVVWHHRNPMHSFQVAESQAPGLAWSRICQPRADKISSRALPKGLCCSNPVKPARVHITREFKLTWSAWTRHKNRDCQSVPLPPSSRPTKGWTPVAGPEISTSILVHRKEARDTPPGRVSSWSARGGLQSLNHCAHILDLQRHRRELWGYWRNLDAIRPSFFLPSFLSLPPSRHRGPTTCNDWTKLTKKHRSTSFVILLADFVVATSTSRSLPRSLSLSQLPSYQAQVWA